MKLLTLLSASMLLSGLVHAEWDPRYLPSDAVYQLESVEEPVLQNLESSVCAYLQNSWCSEDKARMIMELVVITRPQTSVEIGAFMGASTLPLLAATQYLNEGDVYVVEPWSNEEAVRGLPSDDPNTAWWATLSMEAVRNHFLHMAAQWGYYSAFELLNMTSADAAPYIGTIDFLHLDGNFSENGALMDSELYIPKVNSGGYVLVSNALVMIGGKATKMRALWPLFEHCDIICETDNGNTLLFRKK